MLLWMLWARLLVLLLPSNPCFAEDQSILGQAVEPWELSHQELACPSAQVNVRLPPSITDSDTNASWHGPSPGWSVTPSLVFATSTDLLETGCTATGR